MHPTYVHAMNNLGNILKERNELVEAEQLLSKAVSIQYVSSKPRQRIFVIDWQNYYFFFFY